MLYINNIDFIDKLNFLSFLNYLFTYNFILSSYFFIRIPNIKKENTFSLIKYFTSFEFWSNNKILIKKIKFYYKLNALLINFFFKTKVLGIINWLAYFKFIFISYYMSFLNKNIYYYNYENSLIFFFSDIFKIHIILKNLKKINIAKYVIFFYKIMNIQNIFITSFINFFKNFMNFEYKLLWSIYL